MKNSIILSSLANKYYDSSRDENYEPIHNYNNEYMRWFVRQSIKEGRRSALQQCYKSKHSDEVFNIISKELDINGKLCEILEKYFEYINKLRKLIDNNYDSQLEDYRDKNRDEKSKKTNDKLSEITIHESSQKLNLNDVMTDFGATSLYSSAMYDKKSVYPKIESGFAFKANMNNIFVEALTNQFFNRDESKNTVLELNFIIQKI